jgi:hypothetical protein
MIKIFLLLLPLVSFAGKLQDADFKSDADINDSKLIITAKGFNNSLKNILSNRGTVGVSTTYTVQDEDGLIVANSSSGAFTVTLPPCDTDNSGRVIKFSKSNNELNKVTILRAGSDTIGNAKTSIGMLTPGEAWSLACDDAGTNWKILSHKTETGWISYGGITITGSGAPGFGTIVDNDLSCRRTYANYAQCRWTFRQSSSGANGTSEYLYALPTGYEFSFAQIVPYSGAASSGAAKDLQAAYVETEGHIGEGTGRGWGVYAFANSSTSFRVAYTNNNGGYAIHQNGAPYGLGQVASANLAFRFIITFAVDGWDE